MSPRTPHPLTPIRRGNIMTRFVKIKNRPYEAGSADVNLGHCCMSLFLSISGRFLKARFSSEQRQIRIICKYIHVLLFLIGSMALRGTHNYICLKFKIHYAIFTIVVRQALLSNVNKQ